MPGLRISILAVVFKRHTCVRISWECGVGVVQTDYWASPQSFCRDLMWGLRICVPSKYPAYAHTLVCGPLFENHHSRSLCLKHHDTAESPRSLAKMQVLIQQVWHRGPSLCSCHKLPGDADVAGTGATLWWPNALI